MNNNTFLFSVIKAHFIRKRGKTFLRDKYGYDLSEEYLGELLDAVEEYVRARDALNYYVAKN